MHLRENFSDQCQEHIHEHNCVKYYRNEVEQPLQVRPESNSFTLVANNRANEGGLEHCDVLARVFVLERAKVSDFHVLVKGWLFEAFIIGGNCLSSLHVCDLIQGLEGVTERKYTNQNDDEIGFDFSEASNDHADSRTHLWHRAQHE